MSVRAGKRATQLSFGVIWRDELARTICFAIVSLAIFAASLSFAGTEKQSIYVEGTATEIYAVIFGITVGHGDKLDNIRIGKVIDPMTGSTEAVDIPVPEVYFESAKAMIEAKGYKAKLKDGVAQEFFTYFFYDPQQPEIVITEIKK